MHKKIFTFRWAKSNELLSDAEFFMLFFPPLYLFIRKCNKKFSISLLKIFPPYFYLANKLSRWMEISLLCDAIRWKLFDNYKTHSCITQTSNKSALIKPLKVFFVTEFQKKNIKSTLDVMQHFFMSSAHENCEESFAIDHTEKCGDETTMQFQFCYCSSNVVPYFCSYIPFFLSFIWRIDFCCIVVYFSSCFISTWKCFFLHSCEMMILKREREWMNEWMFPITTIFFPLCSATFSF